VQFIYYKAVKKVTPSSISDHQCCQHIILFSQSQPSLTHINFTPCQFSFFVLQRRECLCVTALRMHKYRNRMALDMKLTCNQHLDGNKRLGWTSRRVNNLEWNWGEEDTGWQRDYGEAWLLNDQHKSRNNEESSTAVLGLQVNQLLVLFTPPTT
jgi:hypothetical protein